MTRSVRGHPTWPTTVPKGWRGRLPDLSAQRRLPVRDGYAAVPQSLLHCGCPDLGVLVWTQLRLWFNDEVGITTYLELAAALGLDEASAGAIERRFSIALQPLLGTWIVRTRVADNLYSYRAVWTDPKERWAMIRRCDLTMLGPNRKHRAKPGDVVDFARWQLECGRRGWTAESTTVIAQRWKVTRPTIRASRARLADLRLLEVVERDGPGRLSEMVWLKEVYDPAWESSSVEPVGPRRAATSTTRTRPQGNGIGLKSGNERHSCSSRDGKKKHKSEGWPARIGGGDGKEKHKTDGQATDKTVGKIRTSPIRDLSGSLAVDLSDLGGASAPPLKLVTRATVDAPPAASSTDTEPEPGGRRGATRLPDPRRTASRILGGQRRLVSAAPHFRRVMLQRLTAALTGGLLPEHAERALALVIEEGAFDAECLLLERALQQAWSDQLAGMCPGCGGARADHAFTCDQFTVRDVSPSVWQAGRWPREPHPAAGEDPLAGLLRSGPDLGPVESGDDDAMLQWMRAQLAQRIADTSDREARLRTLWLHWRTRLPPGQRELLDRAAAHVHHALTRHAS